MIMKFNVKLEAINGNSFEVTCIVHKWDVAFHFFDSKVAASCWKSRKLKYCQTFETFEFDVRLKTVEISTSEKAVL